MTLKYGSRRYKKALKELGLTVYKRIDPEGSKWGLYAEYLVAPLIENAKQEGRVADILLQLRVWEYQGNNEKLQDEKGGCCCCKGASNSRALVRWFTGIWYSARGLSFGWSVRRRKSTF